MQKHIPLRYQLLFMASRSFIHDPVVSNGMTLPLFRRNVEKERFERAALWLRRAVEQLLLARGVGFKANQTYNIQAVQYSGAVSVRNVPEAGDISAVIEYVP
jgi:hypothetical protein